MDEPEAESLIELETQSSISIDQLSAKLNTFWLNPDIDAVKILIATIISFELDCDPVWLFLIAPPASLKTEFISAVSLLPNNYYLSSLTPQTLVSGMVGKKDKSLLTKIGSKVLLFKDFTTILASRYEEKQKILSQLREIYDGKFSAEYGTGARVDWEGKITFIAGVTPIIDEHSSVSAMLGERFIQYRLPGVDEKKVAIMSMKNAGKSTRIREEVKQLFYNFYKGLKIPELIDDIIVSEKWINKLAELCSFVVRARAGVSRNHYTKELEYIPDPESPARLARQFIVLLKCLAIVNGKNEVTEKEYKIILKVAFDCIPYQRIIALNALLKSGAKKAYSTSEISRYIGYSTKSTGWFLEELSAFKLVDVEKKSNMHNWNVSQRTLDYLSSFLVDVTYPEPHLSNFFKWFNGDVDKEQEVQRDF